MANGCRGSRIIARSPSGAASSTCAWRRVGPRSRQIRTQSIADSDLTLNEAAALLMLSSDVRKLLNFAKQAEGLSGEAFIKFCISNNVATFNDPNYNPFAGRSEAEQQEWLVFVLFLSYDGAAGRTGLDPDDAWRHVEYLLQRPFQTVDEWLGPEGDEWRRRCSDGRQFTEEMRLAWAAFRDARRHLTLADLEAEHGALVVRFQEDAAAGLLPKRRRRAGRGGR
jgi:hypothetical protein